MFRPMVDQTKKREKPSKKMRMANLKYLSRRALLGWSWKVEGSGCRLYSKASSVSAATTDDRGEGKDVAPTSGICRPLSEILKELNKKVPDSLIKTRVEPDGFAIRYIPWHTVNRILNLHAPEWSGEVRNISYSAKSVSVVYRVTLYGTDAEIFRESTGTASIDDTSYGDPVQKAEAMAFRRACARFGLGLHLYHEDVS